MKDKLNNQELFQFCEQFSLLLHSGISVMEGLTLLHDDSTNEKSKEIFSSIMSDLEENGSFAEALEHSGLFPKSMNSYIKAGEETGCLDEVMSSLSRHYDQEITIAGHIRSAVTYPLLMLGMMAGVIIILLVKVLPVFEQVFSQMGMQMNTLSDSLLHAGMTIGRYSSVFVSFAVVFILCLLYLFLNEKGRNLLKNASFHTPGIRDISLTMDYSRLTQALSMGIRSGLDHDTSFSLARELVSHPALLKKIDQVQTLLKDGFLLTEALTQSRLFQGMDDKLVAIGLHTGSADEVLSKLSRRYQENSLSVIENIISVIEPTIVIIFSLLVGLVLLSVMMPLLGILSEIVL